MSQSEATDSEQSPDPSAGPETALQSALEGDELQEQGRVEEAIAAYERALARDPDCQAAWYSLGCAWMRHGEEARAAGCFERSILLRPGHGESHHNLGKACFKLGLIDAALLSFHRALELGGGFVSRTALATVIPGSPKVENPVVLHVRRGWAHYHLPPADPRKVFSREPIAGRKLRIGYLSSFLGWRNWMKPVWGLVNHHDRLRFEVHLFSDGSRAQCGESYREQAGDRFHDLTGLSNREVAALMEAEQIDVLVDLNGYSSVDRLAVIALQPAPVVVGWFNLFATSGMEHYNYLIGDSHVIPEEEERFYVEKILRVRGSYLTFEVAYPVPPVSEPPSCRLGRFTFGSLASQHKITPEVVASWATILQQAPDAFLFIQNTQMGSTSNQEHLLRQFAGRGIAAERLILEGPAEHFEFLKAYDQIDVALDTFPYNGGTTTMEALWQGVPVLTFSGDRWVSRTSASLLRDAGLGEFVASDRESFIAEAIRIANNPDTPGRLGEFRRTIRRRLVQSSVCDTVTFARRMEAIYGQIAASGIPH